MNRKRKPDEMFTQLTAVVALAVAADDDDDNNSDHDHTIEGNECDHMKLLMAFSFVILKSQRAAFE